MHRVRAIKNYHVITLILKNKNKVKRVIRDKEAKSFKMSKKLIDNSSVNE